jgi:4-amino-4-deoxychorismate lyase
VTRPVVAVLTDGSAQLVDPETPVIPAGDPGFGLGDGLFETMHLRGEPWLLEEHLDRLVSAADRMHLPLPRREELASLARTVAGAWTEEEGALKLICTRGGRQVAIATPLPEGIAAQRRDGVRVVSAQLSVGAEARAGAPWLLGGLKTLSFAINMATQRWARSQGADDAIFLSLEGMVLEGTTSNVVWLDGKTICTTPAETGILPGVTAEALRVACALQGVEWEARLASVSEVQAASAVWLCSSVRGLAPVRVWDGVPVGDVAEEPRLTRGFQSLLGFAV